ncbi:MAG: T9SS type A sorting domain-containing protein [Bacteroidota bacterium]
MLRMRTLITVLFLHVISTLSAQVTDILTDLSSPLGLAIDGETLYYSEGGFDGDRISSINLNDVNPVPEVVAMADGPNGLLLLDQYLYFTDDAPSLQRLDLSVPGASPELLSTDFDGIPFALVSYNSEIYLSVTNASQIVKIDPNAANPTVELVIAPVNLPFGLAILGDDLYFTQQSTDLVSRITLTEPDPEPENIVSILELPGGLTFIGNTLYCSSGSEPVEGKVHRINLDQIPATVEELANDLVTPRLLINDGQDLFFAQVSNGKISRLGLSLSWASLPPVCENTMPMNLGGANPAGGVYSGPGVTDNGDGLTFSFDPSQAGGPGSYTITYTLDNPISTTLEVLPAPTVTFTSSLSSVFENAGTQLGLSGGSPVGGVYSGPGVTDNNDGMTFDFDPVAAGGVGIYPLTYTFINTNGCESSATDEIEVSPAPGPYNECPEALDISSLFGSEMGEVNISQLVDNSTNTSTSFDPAVEPGCFLNDDEFTHTVWFTFTGTGDLYTIRSIECSATDYITDGDTQVSIYTGDCSNPIFVACNEDEDFQAVLFNFRVDLQTEENTEYRMVVDGFNFATGEYCIEVTNIQPNSTSQMVDTNITLFPNPVSGTLQIRNIEADLITLFDAQGRTVLSQALPGQQLNLASLPAGMYFVQIQKDGAILNDRIIKQ